MFDMVFGVVEDTFVSSKYRLAYCHLAFDNITSITDWNVAGAIFKQEGIFIK